MPITLSLSAKPHFYQILVKPAEIKLKVDITIENSYDKVWKFPTYMGMKIGLSSVRGDISWLDEDGDYSIPLTGWGTSWSMRALL